MYSQRLSQGVGDLVSAFMNGGQAQRKGELSASKDAYNFARADEAGYKAQIEQDRLSARGSLGDMFSGLSMPEGMDPELMQGIVRSASSFNPEQVSGMIQQFSQMQQGEQSMNDFDAGNVGRANAGIDFAHGRANTPYSLNANGMTINEGTGVIDEGSRMAQGSIAAEFANALQSNASAANSNNMVTNRDRLGDQTIKKSEQDMLMDVLKYQNPQHDVKPNYNVSDDLVNMFKSPLTNEDGGQVFDLDGRPVMQTDQDRYSQAIRGFDGQGDINDPILNWLKNEQHGKDVQANAQAQIEHIMDLIRAGKLEKNNGFQMINSIESMAENQ